MNHAPENDWTRSLAENLARVERQIDEACHAAGRRRDEVELVAVSKTHPVAALVAAHGLGLTLFGENRVQEFATKATTIAAAERSAMRVHLIGHLQSNKAARAVEIFDGIDSVDSLKLAERLNQAVRLKQAASEAASERARPLPILLEIKLSAEPTKSGLVPDSPELAELLAQLPSLPHIHVDGLMTIAPLDASEDQTRTCFRQLRQLRERLADSIGLPLPVLSMGMSGDFPLAIAEGATRIRIGTALFGQRPPAPSVR